MTIDGNDVTAAEYKEHVEFLFHNSFALEAVEILNAEAEENVIARSTWWELEQYMLMQRRQRFYEAMLASLRSFKRVTGK